MNLWILFGIKKYLQFFAKNIPISPTTFIKKTSKKEIITKY